LKGSRVRGKVENDENQLDEGPETRKERILKVSWMKGQKPEKGER
jgi:hypothetical protein